MITRIEIDGFKTFEQFELNLQPFSAVVGPNASGKSNLFDALRFLSLLSQFDVRSAIQGLRGEPEELFRQTSSGIARDIRFAIEVLLNNEGIDSFGTKYEIKSQRLRYELNLTMRFNEKGMPHGIYVLHESCVALARRDEKSNFIRQRKIRYSSRKTPFISMVGEEGRKSAIEIRQDGPTESGTSKRGRPVKLSASEASRTALSTITTAEFPHLYALRDLLISMRFLEINPTAARAANDRFEVKTLKADASNLAAVLAHLKENSSSEKRPEGAISDISADLSSLIPTVRKVEVFSDSTVKDYSFSIKTSDGLIFSSRVISDGTLRILALLSILDDPNRKGVLCFEEPENGVHEGRIPALIQLLRLATSLSDIDDEPLFQILINTHSPAVLKALEENEIIAADIVTNVNPDTSSRQNRTRMRTGVVDQLEIDPERNLTRAEINRILQRPLGEA